MGAAVARKNGFSYAKGEYISFVDADFQNVASILKDQMDAYKIGMEKLMDESLTEEARPILNNIFTGFGSLENRINNMEQAVKSALANSNSRHAIFHASCGVKPRKRSLGPTRKTIARGSHGSTRR